MWRLALAIDADGVHIGAEDISLVHARSRLGAKKLIGGVLLQQSRTRAGEPVTRRRLRSLRQFFSSPTKPGAVAAPLSLLSDAKAKLHVPIVAIGGITLDNAPALIEAGANAIAIISALFDSADIPATTKNFSELFKPTSIHSNQSVSTL